MLLGIWMLRSRAFFAKVRPDKLAEQILLMLVLYSLYETSVIGTNIRFAVRSAGPFLMIINWIRLNNDWKVAIILSVPPR
jgi:hypothetical protein